MRRYEIIIYWSQADEAFIAEVPELPGCAADGKRYKEALANVEVIIEEWIEPAKNWAGQSPHRAAAWPLLERSRLFSTLMQAPSPVAKSSRFR